MIGDCYEQAHAPLNEPVELYPNLNDYVDKLTPDDDPLQHQVGGDHYKKLNIQPIEYIIANDIPYIEGNIIKYATRWRDKGGIKDLEKIKHYVDFLISIEKSKE